MLTTLTVVNDCLATMGEAPLSALDEGHPFAASALRILDVASTREQAKGWWFNKEIVTLSPDADDSFIYVPNDTLSVKPTDNGAHYVQRGRRLFKRFAAPGADSFIFETPVQCWLIRFLPFDDLPAPAQLLVAAVAVRDFQNDYDADGNKMRTHEQRVREAYVQLNAEEIRNQGANLLQRHSTAAVMSALSPRGARRVIPTF